MNISESGTIDFDEFEKIFSSKLTVDPDQELHEVFCIFDSNLDGFISDEELFAVLQKLGEQTSMVFLELYTSLPNPANVKNDIFSYFLRK